MLLASDSCRLCDVRLPSGHEAGLPCLPQVLLQGLAGVHVQASLDSQGGGGPQDPVQSLEAHHVFVGRPCKERQSQWHHGLQEEGLVNRAPELEVPTGPKKEALPISQGSTSVFSSLQEVHVRQVASLRSCAEVPQVRASDPKAQPSHAVFTMQKPAPSVQLVHQTS